MSDQVRRAFLDAYRAAVAAVDPHRVTVAALGDLDLPSPITALALGKASAAMATATSEVLGSTITEMVVVSDHTGPVPPDARLMIGSHPLCDERSQAAGTALLEAAVEADPDGSLLVLVSGGGSALAEVPAPGLSIGQVRAVHQALMHAGVPIAETNIVRRHLSLLKNGGLTRASPAPVTTLLISDVVGYPPSVIASGPTLTDGSTPADAIEILDRFALRSQIPDEVVAVLGRATPPSPPSMQVRIQVIADASWAATAARSTLEEKGLEARITTVTLEGDAAGAAREFIADLEPGVAHIAAGETTVEVGDGGRGGRCQHAALAAALELAGSGSVFAALGTDGRDGPTDAAGAIVDGETAARIQNAGIDPQAALDACDSHPGLDAAGALVRTGPTGTNVADLWMGWRP